MEKKKLEYFKKRLESRQVELRRMVTRTEQDGRTVDEDSAQDIADRAASSYTKEFLFHQSNNDRQLLAMVESALDRIREGNFGECISCGKEINPKRLEAVPWTRHCIECQEKLEQGLLEQTSPYFGGFRFLKVRQRTNSANRGDRTYPVSLQYLSGFERVAAARLPYCSDF